jgi:predicted membrane channel-forming protein YqfA (hemolysin III family)
VIRHSFFRYEFLKSPVDDVSQVNSVSYEFRNNVILKVYERTHQVGQIRTFVLIDNNCNIYTFHVPINTHVIRRFYKNNLLFCYFCEDTIEILKFKTAQICFKTSLQTIKNIQIRSIDLSSVYYSFGKRLYQYDYSKSTKIGSLETIKHKSLKPHRRSEIVPLNLDVIDVYSKILNSKFNKDISNHILQFLV